MTSTPSTKSPSYPPQYISNSELGTFKIVGWFCLQPYCVRQLIPCIPSFVGPCPKAREKSCPIALCANPADSPPAPASWPQSTVLQHPQFLNRGSNLCNPSRCASTSHQVPRTVEEPRLQGYIWPTFSMVRKAASTITRRSRSIPHKHWHLPRMFTRLFQYYIVLASV